jgi:hypothetical protein
LVYEFEGGDDPCSSGERLAQEVFWGHFLIQHIYYHERAKADEEKDTARWDWTERGRNEAMRNRISRLNMMYEATEPIQQIFVITMNSRGGIHMHGSIDRMTVAERDRITNRDEAASLTSKLVSSFSCP